MIAARSRPAARRQNPPAVQLQLSVGLFAHVVLAARHRLQFAAQHRLQLLLPSTGSYLLCSSRLLRRPM